MACVFDPTVVPLEDDWMLAGDSPS